MQNHNCLAVSLTTALACPAGTAEDPTTGSTLTVTARSHEVQALGDLQSRFEGTTMAVQDTWRYVAAAGAVYCPQAGCGLAGQRAGIVSQTACVPLMPTGRCP